MNLWILCLLAFLAGLLCCDLLRWAQQRLWEHRTARFIVRMSGSPEAACREWAAVPEYWCDRPGCTRCWGRWGR